MSEMAPTGGAVIGFWGGMALLISSITGPGLTTIPLLFQQAGWFSPTAAFLVFGAMSGAVSLLLAETMSAIHGNESFQARVEYSTVAHLYLGDKPHLIMQVLLYLALQSVNISSIIISEQTMDSLLIRLFHKTCGLSFTQGWVCVSEVNPAGSPFDSYILFSFGYLIAACLVLPLSVMSLVQNIKFQLASVATLSFVMGCWIFIFAHKGFHQDIPAFGSDQSSLIGFVLNNFAFITTVPSFINELSRSVSIHKTIAYPILVCVALYLIIGIAGASSFKVEQSSDILATLSAEDQSKVLIILVNILFPISVLVTSVPVFAIVIRYNLVRGNVCSNKYAILWASVLPWLLIIPFQTKGYVIMIMNWASLIFGSSTNFIIPLLLYIASKTYSASTTDAEGGDILVLHQDSSSTSRRSHQTSTHSSRQIPTIITSFPSSTSLEEANVGMTSAISPYAQQVFSPASPSPSRSRKSTMDGDKREFKLSEIEIDLAESGGQSSGSHLDPSIPLRVIYSPSVSREPSIGHRSSIGSHSRPSTTSNIETDLATFPPQTITDEESPRELQLPSTRSRRSSTVSNPASQYPQQNRFLNWLQSSQRTRRRASQSFEVERETPVFVAFPERKWFRSIALAKVALAITTCAVLGNLIYTIIQTARGNNPLS